VDLTVTTTEFLKDKEQIIGCVKSSSDIRGLESKSSAIAKMAAQCRIFAF